MSRRHFLGAGGGGGARHGVPGAPLIAPVIRQPPPAPSPPPNEPIYDDPAYAPAHTVYAQPPPPAAFDPRTYEAYHAPAPLPTTIPRARAAELPPTTVHHTWAPLPLAGGVQAPSASPPVAAASAWTPPAVATTALLGVLVLLCCIMCGLLTYIAVARTRAGPPPGLLPAPPRTSPGLPSSASFWNTGRI